jgi:hypothetical protein
MYEMTEPLMDCFWIIPKLIRLMGDYVSSIDFGYICLLPKVVQK